MPDPTSYALTPQNPHPHPNFVNQVPQHASEAHGHGSEELLEIVGKIGPPRIACEAGTKAEAYLELCIEDSLRRRAKGVEISCVSQTLLLTPVSLDS